MRRNIKMLIMYDGGGYSGWQRLGKQQESASIQGVLEDRLSTLFQQEVKLTAASRTDQGVHAYGQAANFYVDAEMEPKDMARRLNEILPEDIRIWNMEQASMEFHSRHCAKAKVYEYIIDVSEKADVFTRRYTCPHPAFLNLLKMQEAADYLVGEHDYTSFCNTGRDSKTTVRTIYSIAVFKAAEEKICIQLKGNGFLYNMARIIVGSLIEVGEEIWTPSQMEDVLKKKDRSFAGPTAPYQGLFLREVIY